MKTLIFIALCSMQFHIAYCQEKNDLDKQIDSLVVLAQKQGTAADPSNAIKTARSAKQLILSETSDSLTGVVNGTLAGLLILKGSDEALEVLAENKVIWENLPYNIQAFTMEKYGWYHRFKENLDSTLHYFYAALQINAEENNRKGMARGYLNIGMAYAKLGDEALAGPFYDKSLSYSKSKEDTSIKGLHSPVDSDVDQLAVSRDIRNYALENNNYMVLVNEYDAIAKHALLRNLPDTAINYAKKRLELINTRGLNFPTSTTLNYLGEAYYQKEKFRQAIFYYEQALAIDPIPVQKLKAMDGIQNSHKNLGEYAMALDMARSIINVKDSLEKADQEKYMLELSTRFNLNEKENQIEELNEAKEQFEKRLKSQRSIWVGSLLALLVFGIGLLYIKRKKKNPAEQILIQPNLNNSAAQKDVIALADAKNVYQVKISDIVYIKAASNYCSFQLKDKKPLLISKPLKYYADQLSEHLFFRCHQSYLVALDKISSLEKTEDTLLLSNNERIPISTKRKKELVSILNENQSSIKPV